MLKIGITGGIGSGKSTVAKCFFAMGVPIYEADARAKLLINQSQEVKTAIIKLLGKQAYTEMGQYNKAYVANKVFDNTELLMNLNQIVHPAVKNDFETWLKSQNTPYIIKEAAIMDKQSGLDKIIVVHSPKELRLARVHKRDGRSIQDIEKIIDNQKTEEQFLAMADFVIKNNQEEFIMPQVLNIHQELLQMADLY